MKKPTEARRVAGVSRMEIVDEPFSKKHPTLWDHLTSNTWDDGTQRKTSTLLIMSGDGMVKGMLKDREASLCLWVAAPGFFKLLAVLEAALNDPQQEWRLDRAWDGAPAKRTKRKD